MNGNGLIIDKVGNEESMVQLKERDENTLYSYGVFLLFEDFYVYYMNSRKLLSILIYESAW